MGNYWLGEDHLRPPDRTRSGFDPNRTLHRDPLFELGQLGCGRAGAGSLLARHILEDRDYLLG